MKPDSLQQATVGEGSSHELAVSSPPAPGVVRRRRTRRRSELSRALKSKGERIAIWLQIALVIGSAQALGAVHLVTQCIAAVIGLSACVICYRARLVPGWKVPGPAVVLVALSAFSLLQAVPLPAVLVAKIAPASAEVWAGALAPFREEGPRFVPLSLDPGASTVEALKWLLYAAAFTTAAVLGASRGPSFGALWVFASGALVALSSLGHRLLGATTAYGVYEPIGEFAREKLGPLLNPNNLSGYLNVGTFCGFGLLIMRRPPLARWVLGLGVALQLGALIEAGSRGGLGGFFVGLLALGPLLIWARRKGDPGLAEPRVVRSVVLGVLAGGGLLAALGLNYVGANPLDNQNIDKVRLLPWLLPMVGEHWLFGIGRGAFESVFPAFKLGSSNVVYTHPENFIAQWVSEWGLPIGLGGLLLLGWTLRPVRLGLGRETVTVGVTAALVALLTQNLVDLGLEVPAIVLAAVTALGACWGGARQEHAGSQSSERHSSRWSPRLAWSLAAISGVALVLAAYFGRSPVGAERRRINQQVESTNLGDRAARDALRAELRGAMLRHPAEPYFPRIGGYIAWRARDESPLPWIDRALERGITSGRTHYLLARVLATNNNVSQALMEARFAIEYDAELVPRVAELAVSIATNGRQLLAVVPQRSNPNPTLRALLKLTQRPEQASLRHDLLEATLERYPQASVAKEALASDLIASLAGKRHVVLCDGSERTPCVERARSLALDLARAQPESSRSVELQAELLLALGRASEAERYLAAECERFTPNRSCLKLRLAAVARAKSGRGIEETARALIATGCETPAACAESFEALGDELQASGNSRLALRHYERAAKEEPSLGRWLKLAKAASNAGAHLQAADALSHALNEKGADPELEQRIRLERQRAFRQQLSGLNGGKEKTK